MIAPPNIEGAAVALLDAGMTADVATRVENPRPSGSYVRVTAVGGNPRNLVQVEQRLLIECWGASQQTALDTARLAWALLWAAQDSYMAAGVYVSRIESTAPVNFPDPDTDSARYQFVASVTASMTEVSA